jgi:hypothetical protein
MERPSDSDRGVKLPCHAETAKIVMYCKQFGSSITLIPDEWVEQLVPLADFV